LLAQTRRRPSELFFPALDLGTSPVPTTADDREITPAAPGARSASAGRSAPAGSEAHREHQV
jgi:hypothetical protein